MSHFVYYRSISIYFAYLRCLVLYYLWMCYDLSSSVFLGKVYSFMVKEYSQEIWFLDEVLLRSSDAYWLFITFLMLNLIFHFLLLLVFVQMRCRWLKLIFILLDNILHSNPCYPLLILISSPLNPSQTQPSNQPSDIHKISRSFFDQTGQNMATYISAILKPQQILFFFKV